MALHYTYLCSYLGPEVKPDAMEASCYRILSGMRMTSFVNDIRKGRGASGSSNGGCS